MASLHKMFVYGTLKRGQGNYSLLTDPANGSAVYIGAARTEVAYPMVIATSYNIPFILPKEGTGHNILGEVFEVDDKMRDTFDELESHPDWYRRILTNVTLIKDKDNQLISPPQPLSCWCYFLQRPLPSLFELPYLESWPDTTGRYNLEYVTRDMRDDPPNDVPNFLRNQVQMN